ncbi:MAG: inositol monophosphatase family protein, partial [Chloroflexota bacterium]
MTTLLEIALRAAREAGSALREAYARPHAITVKGLRDIATEADLEAEALSIGVIRGLCPEARFVSEESNQQLADYGDLPTWYIDPLDGTTNFARGLPGFCISVAAAVGGVLQAGAVYDPLTDQMFHGERGGGAYLNGQRLHVSARATLMESVVLADWPREQVTREQSARFLA